MKGLALPKPTGKIQREPPCSLKKRDQEKNKKQKGKKKTKKKKCLAIIEVGVEVTTDWLISVPPRSKGKQRSKNPKPSKSTKQINKDRGQNAFCQKECQKRNSRIFFPGERRRERRKKRKSKKKKSYFRRCKTQIGRKGPRQTRRPTQYKFQWSEHEGKKKSKGYQYDLVLRKKKKLRHPHKPRESRGLRGSHTHYRRVERGKKVHFSMPRGKEGTQTNARKGGKGSKSR